MNKEIKDELNRLDDEWDRVRQRADELSPDGFLPRENFEKFHEEVLDKWKEISEKREALNKKRNDNE